MLCFLLFCFLVTSEDWNCQELLSVLGAPLTRVTAHSRLAQGHGIFSPGTKNWDLRLPQQLSVTDSVLRRVSQRRQYSRNRTKWQTWQWPPFPFPFYKCTSPYEREEMIHTPNTFIFSISQHSSAKMAPHSHPVRQWAGGYECVKQYLRELAMKRKRRNQRRAKIEKWVKAKKDKYIPTSS